MRDDAESTCLCCSLVRSSSMAQSGIRWHRQHTPSHTGQWWLAEAKLVVCLLTTCCMWPEAYCCPGQLTRSGDTRSPTCRQGWLHLFESLWPRQMPRGVHHCAAADICCVQNGPFAPVTARCVCGEASCRGLAACTVQRQPNCALLHCGDLWRVWPLPAPQPALGKMPARQVRTLPIHQPAPVGHIMQPQLRQAWAPT